MRNITLTPYAIGIDFESAKHGLDLYGLGFVRSSKTEFIYRNRNNDLCMVINTDTQDKEGKEARLLLKQALRIPSNESVMSNNTCLIQTTNLETVLILMTMIRCKFKTITIAQGELIAKLKNKYRREYK